MILKKGDLFVVVKENPSWNDYALKGWQGEIKEYHASWKQYSVRWLNKINVFGNLVNENMIIKIAEIKKPVYKIVKFLNGDLK